MQSFGADDEERDSAGSPARSSDTEHDNMDVDGDADADEEPEPENENEDNQEDHEDEDDEQDQDSQDSFVDARGGNGKLKAASHGVLFAAKSQTSSFTRGSIVSGPTSHPSAATLSNLENYKEGSFPLTRPEALTAPVYDIVPTIAAPHSTSINAVTATPDLRWVFTGGSDGYTRKFNWLETANGKSMLTVAQKHPFVDSVTKAGVLMSYWENEDSNPKSSANADSQALCPVYSLAVQHEGLWLLSGLESGGINLQSVRHDEGKLIHCLRQHTSAISVLDLAQDECSVLSGSWDKTIIDWDLDTGKVKRTFQGSGGQISAIEIRPMSGLAVPEASGEIPISSETFSSDSNNKPRPNGVSSSSEKDGPQENGVGSNAGSPADSLFGGGNDADSLFGDNDDGEAGAPSASHFAIDDEDNEFSRAIANSFQEQESQDADGDVKMQGTAQTTDPPLTNGASVSTSLPAPGVPNTEVTAPEASTSNGLPKSEDMSPQLNVGSDTAPDLNVMPSPDSVFLAASFDGSLRVWDKRVPRPVATMLARNVPPWCMNACWSPDGNFIYAGRRNGTVEEYSLHKGLHRVERSFKLPNGSGPVSAVRAMPNGRHLICASFDILRLYDLQQQQTFKHSTVPFLIIPGHRTGVVSQLYTDPTCRYMISTAGNRGWEGTSTEVLLGYEIGIGK